MADRYPLLRQKVIEVLNAAETQKVNFYYAGRNFGPSGWGYVSHVVLLGARRGHGVQIDVVRQRVGIAARYDIETNTLEFPRSDYGFEESKIVERAAIVHECVHALVDGQATRPTPGARFTFGVNALDNETAGYIAAHLYMIYETGKQGVSTGIAIDPPPGKKSVHACARVVARKLQDKPGATVPDDDDLTNLKNAILEHEAYAGIKRNPRKIDDSPGIAL